MEIIDTLVGKTFKFYGVDHNCFKLDSKVYEAIEDESDGYRSMLGYVEVANKEGKIFFRRALATVVVTYEETWQSDLYKLVDTEDGHVWLEFGTDRSDDYYPSFIFEYAPKKSQKVEVMQSTTI